MAPAPRRLDGVWGDDIEIQAMCEIYNRPAEIFSYDPALGAKQLRTFHEQGSGVEAGGSGGGGAVSGGKRARPFSAPMRLSYYGGGHYDSIEGPDHRGSVLPSSPQELGRVERARIALSRSRRSDAAVAGGVGGVGGDAHAAVRLSDAAATEQAQVDDAVRRSRQQYDDLGMFDIEAALAESLDSSAAAEDRQLTRAMLASTADPNGAPVGAYDLSRLDNQNI